MKRPDEVGRDFDEYARRWTDQGYRLEKGYRLETGISPDGLIFDEDTPVERPGDEWGGIEELEQLYRPLFRRLLGDTGPVNVLEIGAGGGRSTQAVMSALKSRVGDYHIVDVSAQFLEVLKDRFPEEDLSIHVVDDVDLSELETDHFDLCIAQSSWSHIGIYDQYRYLRDLRRVLRHAAPVVVNGQFLLGISDDWTWNRFRRRVHQREQNLEGVFHEITGVGVIVETLVRLEYQIEVIHPHGFVARSGQRNTEAFIKSLEGRRLEYPFAPRLQDFADDQPLARHVL